MKFTIAIKLAASFILAILLTAIVGSIAYYNINGLVKVTDQVDHSNRILIKLEAIASGLKDAETGQRGFIITNEDRYLEPYNDARETVDRLLSEVRELTIDHVTHTDRIDRLTPLVDARFSEIQETIELSREADFEDVREIVLTDAGKEVMDEIGSLMADLATDEQLLLTERDTESKNSASQAVFTIILVTLFSAVFLSIVGFVVSRAISTQLSALAKTMRCVVEKGDLSQQITIHNNDEIGDASIAYNELMASLEAVMAEIAEVVTAAQQGDFTKSIDLSGKEGFFRELSLGLNNVMNALQLVMTEIAELVDAGIKGDFSKQVDLQDKQGSFFELSQGLNQLVATSSAGLSDVIRVLGAMAEGDLSQSIDADYQGDFLQLKVYSNNTVRQISEVMAEIGGLVDAANQGNFGSQIEMLGKTGFFKDLSTNLNMLMSTTDTGLNDILRVLGAMAKGDLTESISQDYQSTLGQLKNDTNDTLLKLTDVIKNIRKSAGTVSSSANEIAIGNSELSRQTKEQAYSLEDTSSSMKEMNIVVKQSATNAKDAAVLAIESKSRAELGGTAVKRAITAMEEISQVSNKISAIIGVIDEIASAADQQTSGIDNVNRVINQMDGITQQNAALVEQSSAVSKTMSGQAESMVQLLRFFTVNKTNSTFLALAGTSADKKHLKIHGDQTKSLH
ncbi:MAG: CHASE3 domain-containing protein [Pseudomonadales bacterium]